MYVAKVKGLWMYVAKFKGLWMYVAKVKGLWMYVAKVKGLWMYVAKIASWGKYTHVSRFSGLERLLENTFQNGILGFIFSRNTF